MDNLADWFTRARQSGSSTHGPLIPSKAVNFDLQAIYIAIPKTGSSSMRKLLATDGTAMFPNPHMNILQIRDLLYPYFLSLALGSSRHFPTVNQPTDGEIREYAKLIFKSFLKFSAVRNPWARAVSLWSRREGRIQLREKISFEEFVENHMYASDTCAQPTLHRNQVDWLCDETGKVIVDYVYKVEEFALATQRIEEMTNGRIKLGYVEENVNPESNARDYRKLYSDHTRKLIAQRFERDIDFFKYAF